MDKNTVDECFRTTLSTQYFADLNFFLFFSFIGPYLAARIRKSHKHFSDYFPKQKNAMSFAHNLQVTPEIPFTPLSKVDGLFGFVHS